MILRWLFPRNPARELALIGARQREEAFNNKRKSVARQIRRELGLPEDQRLV